MYKQCTLNIEFYQWEAKQYLIKDQDQQILQHKVSLSQTFLFEALLLCHRGNKEQSSNLWTVQIIWNAQLYPGGDFKK